MTRAGGAWLLLALLAAPEAAAQAPRLEGLTASARVTPEAALLGQRLVYRVEVQAPAPLRIRFGGPATGGAFSWGNLAARPALEPGARPAGVGAWIEGAAAVAEIPLQVFALGEVAVPGIVIEVDDGRGPRRMRVPTARVTIAPVIPASDTAADLRALHGPLAAPWWERVPWTLVIGALLAILVAALLWWRLGRRRAPAPAPAAAPARAADPLAAALAELAALRRLDLPARGEYVEHAFRLTRIVRRYVESAAAAARPGDTTPELVGHLAESRLAVEEVRRLDGLLRHWDRVKFARAATTPEEARRAEGSVEEFLEQSRRPPAAGGEAA